MIFVKKERAARLSLFLFLICLFLFSAFALQPTQLARELEVYGLQILQDFFKVGVGLCLGFHSGSLGVGRKRRLGWKNYIQYHTAKGKKCQVLSGKTFKIKNEKASFLHPGEIIARFFEKGLDKVGGIWYNHNVPKSLVWLNGRAADL